MSKAARKAARPSADPGRDAELKIADALYSYYAEHVSQRCADPLRQETAIVHLEAYVGCKLISDIDIPLCRAYAASRDVSDNTVRRELGVLAAAVNHAVRWGRIDKAPHIELPPSTTRGVDEQAPFYSKDELKRMLTAATGELQIFIVLAYWTGARRASIENLTREQVLWDQKRILLMRPGKRATKKRQPIVPILPQIEPVLAKLMETGGESRLFRTKNFYRPFRSLAESLGLGKRCNPHLLRHSRATHLLQAGKSIYAVSRLLGDTVSTIERVYGHHSADYLAEELGED